MGPTLFLGLGAGVSWGLADFAAGWQARRMAALQVALWSQIASGVILWTVLLALSAPLERHAVLWGMVAGLVGAMALLSFYRALAIGAMSIVAPITACCLLVPALWSFLLGEVPSHIALVGMAVAFAGIVLASIPSEDLPHPSGNTRLVLGLTFVATIGFGTFLILLDHASGVGGALAPIWTAAGTRASGVTLLLLLALATRGVRRPDRVSAGVLLSIGMFDTAANVLFAFGTRQGNLAVVAVLGSLYPVVTVICAQAALGERMGRVQWAGVTLALTGVALLAAG